MLLAYTHVQYLIVKETCFRKISEYITQASRVSTYSTHKAIAIKKYYSPVPPSVSQLLVQFNSNESIVLVCHTHDSPPTIINWYTDDKLIDLSHNSVDMSVNVTDRHTSSFEISLTVACDPSNNMVESYTCDVSNGFGGSNQTHNVEG